MLPSPQERILTLIVSGVDSIEGGREPQAGTCCNQDPAVRPAGRNTMLTRSAMLAPICTDGPSHPSARPDPIASTPPRNLIGISRDGYL